MGDALLLLLAWGYTESTKGHTVLLLLIRCFTAEISAILVKSIVRCFGNLPGSEWEQSFWSFPPPFQALSLVS